MSGVIPSAPATLSRQCFLDGLAPGSDADRWARCWLQVLLTQDGSATLLCETIAGAAIDLQVTFQRLTDDVPDLVRQLLPGRQFIERQVCLSHAGHVMMDNLSYIAVDAIDQGVRRFLDDRAAPIGHLFDTRWTRKRALTPPAAIADRLWSRSGLPDPDAVRSYVLQMPEGDTMLITETFRAGMRWGLPDGHR